MKLNLIITPAGNLHAVYHDAVRLLMPGPIQVERASNVEFENGTWVARYPDGTFMTSSDSRDECLELERAIVEADLCLTAR